MKNIRIIVIFFHQKQVTCTGRYGLLRIVGLPQLELNDVYGNVKENILKLNELLSNNTSSVLFIEQAKLIFQLIVALWDSDGSSNEVFSGLAINVYFSHFFLKNFLSFLKFLYIFSHIFF